MERTKKNILVTLLLVFAVLEAVVATVSAKALGEGYMVGDYALGMVLIAVGVIVAIIIGIASMGGFVEIPEKATKPLIGVIAVIIVAGLLLTVVQTPAEIVDTSTLDDLEFTIEAEALHTGGTHYPDTSFDKSSGHFTVPFRINTTSDTLCEHTDNSSYTDDPFMNFTIRADFTGDYDDNDLAKCHFKIVNPSLYVGTDADNTVLTKDADDEYEAWWVDGDGINSTLTGWVSGGVEEVFWVNLQLNLNEAGLAEATLLKPYLMTMEFYNPGGTWSEQFTVEFMGTHSFN